MSKTKRYGTRTVQNSTKDDKAVRVRGGHVVVKAGSSKTVERAYIDAEYLASLEVAGLKVGDAKANTKAKVS